jgi:hypothetical protein
MLEYGCTYDTSYLLHVSCYQRSGKLEMLLAAWDKKKREVRVE